MAPQFFPDHCKQLQNLIQIGINGSRLLSKNKIAVPESGVYILELFMNGRGEQYILYNNVGENWFLKTFAKLSQGKAPALLAG